MTCRTGIDGNGAVELGDLLAVLSQWGQEVLCPDVVQLQCGVMHLREEHNPPDSTLVYGI